MVHDVWLTMFNQCYKTVFFSINFKINGWRSKTKGWGSTMVPSFGGNTVIVNGTNVSTYLGTHHTLLQFYKYT